MVWAFLKNYLCYRKHILLIIKFFHYTCLNDGLYKIKIKHKFFFLYNLESPSHLGRMVFILVNVRVGEWRASGFHGTPSVFLPLFPAASAFFSTWPQHGCSLSSAQSAFLFFYWLMGVLNRLWTRDVFWVFLCIFLLFCYVLDQRMNVKAWTSYSDLTRLYKINKCISDMYF